MTRGAYHQTSGRRRMRAFDPFWNIGGLLDTALVKHAERKAEEERQKEKQLAGAAAPAGESSAAE